MSQSKNQAISQEANPPQSLEELEFNEWMQLPETLKFFKYLKELRETTKEEWAEGRFISDNHQVFITRSAIAQGGVKLLADLTNLQYKDIEEFYNERNS